MAARAGRLRRRTLSTAAAAGGRSAAVPVGCDAATATMAMNLVGTVPVDDLAMARLRMFDVAGLEVKNVGREWFSLATAEPTEAAPKLAAQTVVVLLPLVGFDDRLFRLGYGGGFYDRTLDLFRQQGRSVVAIGLAYDSQRVAAALPVEPTDERLNAVITPTAVYDGDTKD